MYDALLDHEEGSVVELLLPGRHRVCDDGTAVSDDKVVVYDAGVAVFDDGVSVQFVVDVFVTTAIRAVVTSLGQAANDAVQRVNRKCAVVKHYKSLERQHIAARPLTI
eukprot:5935063-Pyramimonas_sp.AAC.1